jgi:hypothetical protein
VAVPVPGADPLPAITVKLIGFPGLTGDVPWVLVTVRLGHPFTVVLELAVTLGAFVALRVAVFG